MLNFHDRKTGRAALMGIAAAGVAMTLFPSSAMSQDPEPMVFCAYQPELDDLVGAYTITAGPSALTSGGMTIPNPNIETYQSTFAVIDDVLVMFTDGAPSVDFHHIGSDEPDWVGPDNVGGFRSPAPRISASSSIAI